MVKAALMAWPPQTSNMCTAVTGVQVYSSVVCWLCSNCTGSLRLSMKAWTVVGMPLPLAPGCLQITRMMLMLRGVQGQQQLLAGGSHCGAASRQSAAGPDRGNSRGWHHISVLHGEAYNCLPARIRGSDVPDMLVADCLRSASRQWPCVQCAVANMCMLHRLQDIVHVTSQDDSEVRKCRLLQCCS